MLPTLLCFRNRNLTDYSQYLDERFILILHWTGAISMTGMMQHDQYGY